MAQRLRITPSARPALVLERASVAARKLVYVACANRPQKYSRGRSAIVYIGMTKNGVWRIAASAAWKGRGLLAQHGIKRLTFYVVTTTARSGMKSWHLLERALLLKFKDEYGELPIANRQGKNIHWRDEFLYFSPRRLASVLSAYSGADGGSKVKASSRVKRAKGTRISKRRRPKAISKR